MVVAGLASKPGYVYTESQLSLCLPGGPLLYDLKIQEMVLVVVLAGEAATWPWSGVPSVSVGCRLPIHSVQQRLSQLYNGSPSASRP